MGDFEVESVKIKGTIISDLLKEEISKGIKDMDKNINFVALIMMKDNGKNSPPTPIVFNHQNVQEVGEKVMHIDCADSQTLEKIIKLIKK